jgi:iron complex transport system substrate-binding protein
MLKFPPRRIVCLTEETVETLYLLGEQDRIVGVSGYAVRPPQVRREKPRVSAFISADIPKILALEPDLVLTFSDLQADIVASLIRAGVAVHAFNQRDIAGILAMIRTVGALVGVPDKSDALACSFEDRLAQIAARANGGARPKVYFEEWDDPLISGIGWVSELIRIAGGDDVFPELSARKSATERIVTPDQVIAAELARAGLTLHLFNQRDIAGILDMIRTLGALVDARDKADDLAGRLERRLAQVAADVDEGERPSVYFEEWDEPLISGIGWVSELIAIAGGDDAFADLALHREARQRIIADPAEVVRRAPDIIIGSWCGKKFAPAKVAARDGFARVPAVRTGWLREVKSTLILQPGPAALTDGLDALCAIISEWAGA